MTKSKIPLLATALLIAGGASATPINLSGSETNLQQVLDGITCNATLPGCVLGGPSSINVQTDQALHDQQWSLGATGGAFSQIVIEISGYASASRFGIYDIYDHNQRVEMFGGSAGAGARSFLSIGANGSVWTGDIFAGTFQDSGVRFGQNTFGFYLDTPGGTWFSEQNLNSDGADHMVAYNGPVGDSGQLDAVRLPNSLPGYWLPNEYVFAWEDLSSSGWDYDYNDFVVMVESVRAVPEPATLVLFGLGLAMIGISVRRRARRVQQS